MLEISAVIQASVENLQGPRQVPAVNRLRSLGIPAELIDTASALTDGSPEYLCAEAAVVRYAMNHWSVTEEVALEILNGKLPRPEVNHH